jgi:uncharacterized protein YuzE
VILDFDQNGQVVGIEILSLSKRTEPEKRGLFQLETNG